MNRRLVWPIVGLVLISGCTANIREQHYFGAYANNSASSEAPSNFYRLTVEGNTRFTSARYLSGVYDERAVDLFFNEIRTNKNNSSKLFDSAVTEPGDNTTIKPLSPDTEHGVFVLILSTDADSVANTIGSFAESEVVAQAITQLIARDKLAAKRTSDAEVNLHQATSAALFLQLTSQLEDAAAATSATDSERAYRRVLGTLARGLGNDEPFESFDDARRWFELERRAAGNE